MKHRLFLEHIKHIKMELRIHGYYSILFDHAFDEQDVDKLRPHLMSDFKNLIFVEVNSDKKYFIVDENGKKTVLKLIDNVIYLTKRALVNNYSDQLENYLKYLNKVRKQVEKVRFKI